MALEPLGWLTFLGFLTWNVVESDGRRSFCRAAGLLLLLFQLVHEMNFGCSALSGWPHPRVYNRFPRAAGPSRLLALALGLCQLLQPPL